MEPESPHPTWTERTVGDRVFQRIAVPTRWLDPDGGDRLAPVLLEHLPALSDGDSVIISEKVAVLLTGRSVPSERYPARLPARILIRFVQPRQGSRGLSVPEKMQYVVSVVGLPRVLLAAAVSSVTRPFGVRGMFYRIAGPVARDLDGGRPPYDRLLFPPLGPDEAAGLVEELQQELGAGVAIVDINDFGGTIRATSSRALSAEELLPALADNPLGQRSSSTPFGIVRAVTSS